MSHFRNRAPSVSTPYRPLLLSYVLEFGQTNSMIHLTGLDIAVSHPRHILLLSSLLTFSPGLGKTSSSSRTSLTTTAAVAMLSYTSSPCIPGSPLYPLSPCAQLGRHHPSALILSPDIARPYCGGPLYPRTSPRVPESAF